MLASYYFQSTCCLQALPFKEFSTSRPRYHASVHGVNVTISTVDDTNEEDDVHKEYFPMMEHVDENFSKSMDAVMTASFWLQEGSPKPVQDAKPLGDHFNLIFNSCIYDVQYKDEDEASLALADAFDLSHWRKCPQGEHGGRNRRELGSIQSNSMQENKDKFDGDYLSKEANLLESLWDASMIESRGSDSESTDQALAWGRYWEDYYNYYGVYPDSMENI